MNVASYVRVSTEAQAGPERYGLSAQRADITAYALSHDMQIIQTFEDAGVSGATLDRPGLSALLTAAAAHQFQAVIVAKLDRVARDLMYQLWIEKELLKVGVEIVSVAEPSNGDDPTAHLMRQIIGAFAEFEKARITSRMASGRKAKARDGGYAGGRPAFGYGAQRGSRVLTVDETAAATVRQVFALRAQGMPLRSVASVLNDKGLRTAEGSVWHAVQVKRVLDRSALYAGQYGYGGITAAQGRQKRILTT